MSKFRSFFLKCISFFCALPLFASAEGQIAKANEIDIWYETFGQKEDPAILLIMGGLCQGILWPIEFCEQLANEGYYVIRYDHRDAGFSTCFDFQKNPYDLMDMAKDGIGLLDSLGIEKANLVGLSMGGPIAELMSVHFPERVSTITLMATSTDFRSGIYAFDKLPIEEGWLSPPLPIYLNWMHKFLNQPAQNQEEALEQRLEAWQILNGFVVPFETERYREIHAEFLSRMKHPESLTNHIEAIKKSYDLVSSVASQVRVPTVIFHGTSDPIYPPDHGIALSKAIRGCKYIVVEGFGHVPNKAFYDLFVSEIAALASGMIKNEPATTTISSSAEE